MSYNVKIYKYNNGQQIRIYGTLQAQDRREVYDPALDMSSEEIWENIEDYARYLKAGDFDSDDYTYNPEFVAYVSRNRTKQAIYEIVRSNKWDYFITLTLDGNKINRYDYSEIQPKISQWLNNIRKRKCLDLKYIIVPELHKDGAYHFHGLFANCDGLTFSDSGKLTESGDIIYNIDDYSLGFTSASKIKEPDKVRTYILKYITKELCAVTFGKKRYWCSKNLDRPEQEEKTLDYVDRYFYERELLKKAKFVKTVYCKATDSYIKYIEI